MTAELSLRDIMRADRRANRNPRIRLLLTLFRLAHASRGTSKRAPVTSIPIVVLYKLVSEWMLGIEIPSSTRIGPGLKIEHGYGLVINPQTVLGANCLLKHGVTLGIRGAGPNDGAPTLGDGVVLGPGAQILGRVTIGDRVRIGAGAIVLVDVPTDHTAVGNPARVLPPKVRPAASVPSAAVPTASVPSASVHAAAAPEAAAAPAAPAAPAAAVTAAS